MAWLADMREQEDRDIAERKQELEARYAQGQISAEVYEAWKNDISWLSHWLEARRKPVIARWFWALRDWWMYTRVELRCHLRFPFGFGR